MKEETIRAFQSYEAFKRTRPLSPEATRRVAAAVQKDLLEISLSEVRALAAMTQGEVAEVLATTQAQVSRIEGREDHLVSTLRRYVEALGGELEIVARFGDRSVRLRGV